MYWAQAIRVTHHGLDPPTRLRPCWDAVNCNNPREKLTFNAATQVSLHRARCRVRCNWVESHLGEQSLKTSHLLSWEQRNLRAWTHTVKTWSTDWGSLELGKGTLCSTEGWFRLRLPDNWGLQGKCCQKDCLSSVRPNAGIGFKRWDNCLNKIWEAIGSDLTGTVLITLVTWKALLPH